MKISKEKVWLNQLISGHNIQEFTEDELLKIIAHHTTPEGNYSILVQQKKQAHFSEF